MDKSFSTKRIEAYAAKPGDVDRILEIEIDPENRDYTWHNTERVLWTNA